MCASDVGKGNKRVCIDMLDRHKSNKNRGFDRSLLLMLVIYIHIHTYVCVGSSIDIIRSSKMV